jgi:AcrR family transcriptional regulator
MANTPTASIEPKILLADWRSYDRDYGLPGVLDAALSAFVEFGYHGTSVRTIAARADLSVPGLYHHYRSKADLLALLLDQSGEEVLRRAREALAEAPDDPKARLSYLIENIVLYVGHRQRLAHLAREMRCLDAARFKHHVTLRDQLENMVLDQVMAGQESSGFVVEDPWGATRAILVLCRGVADWYSPGGRQTPEEIAVQYTRFAFAILQADA